MKQDQIHPKWWLLYLAVGTILGAYVLEVKRPYSAADHVWIEAGLIILLYTAVMAWISANRVGLLTIDRKRLSHRVSSHPAEVSRSEPGGRLSDGSADESQKRRIWLARLVSLAAMITAFFDYRDK